MKIRTFHYITIGLRTKRCREANVNRQWAKDMNELHVELMIDYIVRPDVNILCLSPL